MRACDTWPDLPAAPPLRPPPPSAVRAGSPLRDISHDGRPPASLMLLLAIVAPTRHDNIPQTGRESSHWRRRAAASRGSSHRTPRCRPGRQLRCPPSRCARYRLSAGHRRCHAVASSRGAVRCRRPRECTREPPVPATRRCCGDAHGSGRTTPVTANAGRSEPDSLLVSSPGTVVPDRCAYWPSPNIPARKCSRTL